MKLARLNFSTRPSLLSRITTSSWSPRSRNSPVIDSPNALSRRVPNNTGSQSLLIGLVHAIPTVARDIEQSGAYRDGVREGALHTRFPSRYEPWDSPLVCKGTLTPPCLGIPKGNFCLFRVLVGISYLVIAPGTYLEEGSRSRPLPFARLARAPRPRRRIPGRRRFASDPPAQFN